MARKSKQSRYLKLAAAAVGLLVIGVVLYLVLRQKDSVSVIPSTNPKQTAPASSIKQQAVENSQSSANTKTPSSGSSATNSAPLIAPSGTFVSNHHPNLSGSPAPSSEGSVCNTTPGASCYIEFVNGGLTKILSTKTADSSGSVYWNWDVKTAGLTVGSWHITAVASLNGQVKSTTDSLDLVVQQ